MSQRRTIFICTGIVLLLLSLGLNAYFIADQRAAARQARMEQGKQMIRSYYDAVLYGGMIESATEQLLSGQSMADRLAYKYQIGLASQYSGAIPALIAYAEDRLKQPLPALQYNPQGYFTVITGTLGSIGSQDGPLREEELEYVTTVHQLFVQVNDWLADYEVENTSDANASAMREGGAWVGIAEKINHLFAEAPEFLFTYSSRQEEGQQEPSHPQS